MGAEPIRVRYSVRELEKKENKALLDNLVLAWDKVQKLSPDDENSFFRIGGYHGEPFEYRPFVDNLSTTDTYVYWGGWCHHGNVLFPLWHRAYLHQLEKALQSQVPGVMIPYWDETSEETKKYGIPHTLTDDDYTFADGRKIPNPLKSFTIPVALKDDLGSDGTAWAKPAGYTTVRYPLSGLVGSEEAREQTAEHNKKFDDPIEQTRLLNKNIVEWINGPEPRFDGDHDQKSGTDFGVAWRYANCLNAPNYTVFSNTTSAAAWNRNTSIGDSGFVSPVEDPHNAVHLAVGGFDYNPGVTNPKNIEQDGILAGANGDMGENNTAGLDPIFFLHHCNVDRMFYLWQKKHSETRNLDIISGYPGTSSSDSQGPTPGIAPGTPLGMDTPLLPFLKDYPQEGTNSTGMQVPVTGKDVVDIAKLGYKYSPGSLDGDLLDQEQLYSSSSTFAGFVRVYGIDRAHFQGSFVIRLFMKVGNDLYHLGTHPVLSRRDVVKCANCLTHMEVEAFFPLPAALQGQNLSDAKFKTVFMHRGQKLHSGVKPKHEIILAD